jgi:hypothetical protein
VPPNGRQAALKAVVRLITVGVRFFHLPPILQICPRTKVPAVETLHGIVNIEFHNRTIGQGFYAPLAEEIDKYLVAELEAIVQLIPELISKINFKHKWVIDDNGEVKTPEQFIVICESYLKELEITIEHFRDRFNDKMSKA